MARRWRPAFHPVRACPRALNLQYQDGRYRNVHGGRIAYTRPQMLSLAGAGGMLMTVTARLGRLADYAHPQPTLAPVELPVLPMFPGGRPAEVPELYRNAPMRLRGEHVFEGASVLVDGLRVRGSVQCERGALPNCADNIVVVALDELPAKAGLHLLQLQNPEGLFSNDFPFYVLGERPRRGPNLISSGGLFDSQGGSVTWDGEASFTIDEASHQTWRVQLSHSVSIERNVEYCLCYTARAEATRYIQVNVDTGADDYRSLMGTAYTPEVGAATRGDGTTLTTEYHPFRHRFVAPETDRNARIVFTLAQSDLDVDIDNVGLYKGRACGNP